MHGEQCHRLQPGIQDPGLPIRLLHCHPMSPGYPHGPEFGANTENPRNLGGLAVGHQSAKPYVPDAGHRPAVVPFPVPGVTVTASEATDCLDLRRKNSRLVDSRVQIGMMAQRLQEASSPCRNGVRSLTPQPPRRPLDGPECPNQPVAPPSPDPAPAQVLRPAAVFFDVLGQSPGHPRRRRQPRPYAPDPVEPVPDVCR